MVKTYRLNLRCKESEEKMETRFKKLNGFTPFEFTITFETEAEAKEFWHRLNCSVSNILKTAEQHRYECPDVEDKSGNQKLFNDFSKIYKPKVKVK